MSDTQETLERLLLNILPMPIAMRLMQGENPIIDSFAEVSVLFADLVGFATVTERLPPTELVKLLHQIFCIFDQLVQKHGVEKIKTVGNSYMVAGGLQNPSSDDAEAVVEMAMAMQRSISRFAIDDRQSFQLRIGISTGPVVAGVIGISKLSYDLWGDTVNLAYLMQSTGVAGRIQVSSATYESLKDKYLFEEREATLFKGKGEMISYWLIGRRD